LLQVSSPPFMVVTLLSPPFFVVASSSSLPCHSSLSCHHPHCLSLPCRSFYHSSSLCHCPCCAIRSTILHRRVIALAMPFVLHSPFPCCLLSALFVFVMLFDVPIPSSSAPPTPPMSSGSQAGWQRCVMWHSHVIVVEKQDPLWLCEQMLTAVA
jgi:hypothetical protein